MTGKANVLREAFHATGSCDNNRPKCDNVKLLNVAMNSELVGCWAEGGPLQRHSGYGLCAGHYCLYPPKAKFDESYDTRPMAFIFRPFLT